MASKSYDLEPVTPQIVYADSQPLAQTSAIMKATTTFALAAKQKAVVIFDPTNLKSIDLVDDDGTYYGKEACSPDRLIYSSSNGISEGHAGVQVTITCDVNTSDDKADVPYGTTGPFKVIFNSGHHQVTLTDPARLGFRAYDKQGNIRARGEYATFTAPTASATVAYKLTTVPQGLGKVVFYSDEGTIGTWYPAGYPNSPCATNNPTNAGKDTDPASDAGGAFPGTRVSQDWTMSFDNIPATVNDAGQWEITWTLQSKVNPRGSLVMGYCTFQTLANSDTHYQTDVDRRLLPRVLQPDGSYNYRHTMTFPGDTQSFRIGIADAFPYGNGSDAVGSVDQAAAYNGATANGLQGGYIYLNSKLKTAGWVGNPTVTTPDGLGDNEQTADVDTDVLYNQQNIQVLVTVVAAHTAPYTPDSGPYAVWQCYNTNNSVVKTDIIPYGDTKGWAHRLDGVDWGGFGLDRIEYGTMPNLTGGPFTKVATWYPTGSPYAPGDESDATTYAKVAWKFNQVIAYKGNANPQETIFSAIVGRPYATVGVGNVRYDVQVSPDPTVYYGNRGYFGTDPGYNWLDSPLGDVTNPFTKSQIAFTPGQVNSKQYPGNWNPFAYIFSRVRIPAGDAFTPSTADGLTQIKVGQRTTATFAPLPLGSITNTSDSYPYKRPADWFFYASATQDSDGAGSLSLRPIAPFGGTSGWAVQVRITAYTTDAQTNNYQAETLGTLDINHATTFPVTIPFTAPQAFPGRTATKLYTICAHGTGDTQPTTPQTVSTYAVGNLPMFIGKVVGPSGAPPYYQAANVLGQTAWIRCTTDPDDATKVMIWYLQVEQYANGQFDLQQPVKLRLIDSGGSHDDTLECVGDRVNIPAANRDRAELYYLGADGSQHFIARGPFKDDLYEGGVGGTTAPAETDQYKGSDIAFTIVQGIAGVGTGVVSIVGVKKNYTLDEAREGITITSVGTSKAITKNKYALGITNIHSALLDDDGGVKVDAVLKVDVSDPTTGQDDDDTPNVTINKPTINASCRRGHFTNLSS